MEYYISLTSALALPILVCVATVATLFIVRSASMKAAIVFVGVLLVAAFPFAYSSPTMAKADGTTRIAHLNAWINGDISQEKKMFGTSTDADIVSLVEVTPELWQSLNTRDEYPHKLFNQFDRMKGVPVSYSDGFVLMSKYPVKKMMQVRRQAVLYEVQHPENVFYVLQMHPIAPVTKEFWNERNYVYDILASMNLPQPLVVVGDHNVSPWQKPVQNLQDKYNLSLAHAAVPTFPEYFPVVPLDYMLTSDTMDVQNVQFSRVSQADHIALIADVNVK